MRVIVNGREVRNPLLRGMAIVALAAAGAVVVASALAWALMLLGLGVVVVVLAFAGALVATGLALPWLLVRAWRRRG
jgi:hypothetical protein